MRVFGSLTGSLCVWQPASSSRLHGDCQRYLCAVHCALSAHVLFLSLLRGQSVARPSVFRVVPRVAEPPFSASIQEYHKNPSSIGGRTYTPYAKWKFREFNELPHLFQTRLDSSHPIAKKYIDQFPKERTALVMRSVQSLLRHVSRSLRRLLILSTPQIRVVRRRLVRRRSDPRLGTRPGSGPPL